MSVIDQLNGNGSMEWTDTEVPPQGREAQLKQIRDGLEQMIVGFFQSWNGYMNGAMVPIPDDTVTVTADGDGIHLAGAGDGVQLNEYFDKNTVLTQAVVETVAAKIVAMPTYLRTDDGLVVSTVVSHINQPPSAPPIEISIQVEYADVDSFQLPSRVIYDMKNVARLEVGLTDCHASLADPTQKP